jgi:hypothetical protein
MPAIPRGEARGARGGRPIGEVVGDGLNAAVESPPPAPKVPLALLLKDTALTASKGFKVVRGGDTAAPLALVLSSILEGVTNRLAISATVVSASLVTPREASTSFQYRTRDGVGIEAPSATAHASADRN